jgi:hypothetical protein
MTTNLQYSYTNDVNFDVRKVLREFTKSIYNNAFYQNRDGLISDADLVPFSKDNWSGYPLQFCQDHYKHQYLYPVVLLANNLGSMFDFRSEKLLNNKIIAPKMTNIISILSDIKE